MTIRRFPRLFTLDQLTEMDSIDAADRRSCCARSCEAQAQRRHLRRHRRRQDDAAERDVGRGARPASGSSPSRTTPSCACSSRTWSRSRRARPTSRARARSRSATSCATRCACAPTASSSARSAARETLDMLQALNTGHEGSLVTVHANSPRRRDPPPRDAGDDERAAHPVRGAARPDQLGDPRDRADRPLRRRQRAASPRSRSSPRRRRETFRLGTVARFEADPIGPDRRSPAASATSRCRPAIAAGSTLMGEQVPAEFGPRPSCRTARAGGRRRCTKDARALAPAAGRDGARDDRRVRCRQRLQPPGGAGRARARRRADERVPRARSSASTRGCGARARARGSRSGCGRRAGRCRRSTRRARASSAGFALGAAAARCCCRRWSRSSSATCSSCRRPALVRRARARQAPRRVHGPAARPRADALQRHAGRALDRRARCSWRRASSTTPRRPRWRAVVAGDAARPAAGSRARAPAASACRRARWRC